jgi:hypothetical protein
VVGAVVVVNTHWSHIRVVPLELVVGVMGVAVVVAVVNGRFVLSVRIRLERTHILWRILELPWQQWRPPEPKWNAGKRC